MEDTDRDRRVRLIKTLLERWPGKLFSRYSAATHLNDVYGINAGYQEVGFILDDWSRIGVTTMEGYGDDGQIEYMIK